ncbi:uncharacterized protein TRAVEDRAFT_23324 [Trametes versicolor FP-101664 SS1]|uniref:uncharacterized protein n=1 Tax=Trametes versicolor (strain FP-101664) TaxID=717944 RepID=UPI0004622338|nr:uncharacterized protein TRAVEDRAFT_23324 [Trametes versicolor FP-101664 SS1]EIW54125.1 hypothetical protein TRAVEDRAFT_23324 [Trametes versicolor FP-101664 SS1]
MSDSGYNIWSVVSSVLGLLGLIRLAWIYTQLPSRKFRALERLMAETEGMFRKGLDDGLYTCETDLCKLHSSFLANLFIDDLRDSVGTLDTWTAEVAGWWGGLSGKIARVHKEVEKLRSKVVDSSSRNRRRLAAEGYAQIVARYSSSRSQERRSSILSFISQDDCSTPSESPSDPGQASDVPPALEWYPPPRRTDSPLPILEQDTPLPARSDAPPHTSLREDLGLATVSDADPHPPSVTPNADQRPDNTPSCKPTCEDARSLSVSETDLKHLLALALGSSSFRDEKGKRHRATRRDVLLRFGQHLFGPDTSFDVPEASSHTRHAKRTRLKGATCRIRGYRELSPQGISRAAGSVHSSDKAPPVLERVKDDEYGAADWQDE